MRTGEKAQILRVLIAPAGDACPIPITTVPGDLMPFDTPGTHISLN